MISKLLYALSAIAIGIVAWFSVSSFYLGEPPKYRPKPDIKQEEIGAKFTDKQRWFNDNCWAGKSWDRDIYRVNVGAYQEYKAKGLNPEIVRAFYYEDVGITVLVNIQTNKVTTWRPGKTFTE